MPWRLMLSREQGKQNLWCPLEGHWTKWVSSSLSWHRVHLRSGFGTGSVTVDVATPCSATTPSEVECRDVEERRPAAAAATAPGPLPAARGGGSALGPSALLCSQAYYVNRNCNHQIKRDIDSVRIGWESVKSKENSFWRRNVDLWRIPAHIPIL